MSNYLFLDANIILDFFRFGADDISEMGKLVTLVHDREVILFSNQHLRNEIGRMRETVISKSLTEFEANKYVIRAPNYCEDTPEFRELVAARNRVNTAHKELLSKIRERISKQQLSADDLIENLLCNSKDIEITESILHKASRRCSLSNPPGKDSNIGGAIHWECMLQSEATHIDIVSNDRDFESDLKPGTIKDFLMEEWKRTKNKRYGMPSVNLFKSLTDYFKSRYPEIELSHELEKRELMSQLEQSPSLASTHSIIAKLDKFRHFTTTQINRLFNALVDNPQVHRIGTDSDVRSFYLRFKDEAWLVDDNLQEESKTFLNLEEDFFFPF